MNTMNTRLALAAVLAIAGLSLSTTGQAADAALQAPSKVVQFGDLNLANRAGVERLYGRIVSAAQVVCKDHAGPRLPEEQARTRLCIEQSVDRAIANVNEASLTALYVAKKNGTPAPSAVMASTR